MIKKRYSMKIDLIDTTDVTGQYLGQVDYINPSIEVCSLHIKMNKETSFRYAISDRKGFDELVEYYLKEKQAEKAFEQYDIDDGYNEFIKKMNREVLCTYDEFMKSDYSIKLNGSKEDIVYFLNKNNIDKNVIITGEDGYKLSINDDDYINYLYNNLNSLDEVFIYGEGNRENVNIKSYKYTIDYIENIAKKVKSHDFSPLEQLMYIYDIVRDRKYKEEKKNEKSTLSRDLTSVITGDNIVCVGFSEMFDKICQKVGIYSCVDYLDPFDDEQYGHARNAVFLKDDKYHIKGIYFFDTTYDSKYDDTNNHFDSYMFFGKKYRIFEAVDKREGNKYQSRFSKIFDIIDDCYRNQRRLTIPDILSLNGQCRKLTGEPLITDEERNELFCNVFRLGDEVDNSIYNKYRKKVLNFIELLSDEIPMEAFVKALTNVRIQEYYENPSKFSLSRRKITAISKKSNYQPQGKEEKLLRSILGIKDYTPAEILRKEKLNKRIEGVRLSKALRLVLEKKESESE